MAFTWTPVAPGNIAKAIHVNEVKTNTDTLASNLSIAPYGWVEMPVSPGDKMKASQIGELQNALDYIDMNNVCTAENATQYSSNDGSNDSSVDGTRNVAVDDNVETGLNSTYRASFLNDNHYTYYNENDATDYGLYYSGRLNGQNTSANSGANASAK